KPPPGDGELIAAFRATAGKLDQAAAGASGRPAADAKRLAAALQSLADGPAANRARATKAVVPGLVTLLSQLSQALTPQKVTLASMPADMKAEWVVPSGPLA